jgi:hypothetical protein
MLACEQGSSGPSGATTSKPATANTTSAAANTTGAAANTTGAAANTAAQAAADDLPTEEEFEEEAAKDITADNLEAEVDKLEKEIGQ